MHCTRFDKGIFRKKAIKTDQGFLKTDAVVTRAGVFMYQNPDGTIRRELRHPNDVFELDSLSSMKMIPITNGHPETKLVNADNAKSLSIGYTGESIKPDGSNVIAPITITDSQGVLSVEGGKNELSLGYEVDLIQEDGTYEGQRYDHRQTNIRYNHLAIVDQGKAGPIARIHLDAQDAIEIKDEKNNNSDKFTNSKKEAGKMATYRIDNIEYEASPEVVNYIGKLESRVDAITNDCTATKTELERIKADRDNVSEKLDKALKIDHAEAIKIAVKNRVALERKAEKVLNLDADLTGDDQAIMCAVIKKVSPSISLDGKSEDYIKARFDFALENYEATNSSIEKQRQQVNNDDSRKNQPTRYDADQARIKMIDNLTSAYKGNK